MLINLNSFTYDKLIQFQSMNSLMERLIELNAIYRRPSQLKIANVSLQLDELI